MILAPEDSPLHHVCHEERHRYRSEGHPHELICGDTERHSEGGASAKESDVGRIEYDVEWSVPQSAVSCERSAASPVELRCRLGSILAAHHLNALGYRIAETGQAPDCEAAGKVRSSLHESCVALPDAADLMLKQLRSAGQRQRTPGAQTSRAPRAASIPSIDAAAGAGAGGRAAYMYYY
eukprot:COSAG02_NODE_1006_length_15265_cov_58.666886_9_plen_180_part_00